MNREILKSLLNADLGEWRINGRDEYLNTAVLVLLSEDDKGRVSFVFQKRAKNISQGGEISFPGGKYDKGKDESFRNTALRECEEEMGLKREDIEVLGKLDTVIAPMGAICEVFVGITKINPSQMEYNEEVEELFSIPVEWFITNIPSEHKIVVKVHPHRINKNTGEKELLLPVEKYGLSERYKEPWGNFIHSVFFYETQYGVIWGLTARMVLDFVSRIEKNTPFTN